MAVDMSRFKSLEAMLASGHDRVIELKFTDVEGTSLYAHSCVLSNWSRVLAHVIEITHRTQPDAAADLSAAAAAGCARHQAIPLDDADISAWEDALSLMYPAVPLFTVTWGNAARLLLLADKYDMPAVTEHVRLFLDTPREAFAPAAAAAGPLRLEAQLTGASTPGLPNVFEWLQVTSKCGLEQHAHTCIRHIITQQLAIPAGLISSIQPQHTEALLNAMQQALQQAQAQLQQAALPSPDHRCACCRNRWYLLPSAAGQQQVAGAGGSGQASRQAAACVHCGEDVVVQGGLAAADLHPIFSQSIGITDDEGDGEDDTDDENDADEEGSGSGSDEAMSQDSNSQGEDDDNDDDDGDDGLAGDGDEDDDDSMLSESEESDDEDDESESEGDTDEDAG